MGRPTVRHRRRLALPSRNPTAERLGNGNAGAISALFCAGLSCKSQSCRPLTRAKHGQGHSAHVARTHRGPAPDDQPKSDWVTVVRAQLFVGPMAMFCAQANRRRGGRRARLNFTERLTEIGLDSQRPAGLRLAALRAAAQTRTTVTEPGWAFSGRATQVVWRLTATGWPPPKPSGRFALSSQQRVDAAQLARALRSVGALLAAARLRARLGRRHRPRAGCLARLIRLLWQVSRPRCCETFSGAIPPDVQGHPHGRCSARSLLTIGSAPSG